MEKTRDLFKKIGDIKGIFHARTGKIKGRDSKDLKEVERFRREGKNKQKCYTKKTFMTQITRMV